MKFGLVLFQELDDGGRLPAEDAAVPEEAAFTDVLFSEAEVRFFAEGFDLEQAGGLLTDEVTALM